MGLVCNPLSKQVAYEFGVTDLWSFTFSRVQRADCWSTVIRRPESALSREGREIHSAFVMGNLVGLLHSIRLIVMANGMKGENVHSQQAHHIFGALMTDVSNNVRLEPKYLSSIAWSTMHISCPAFMPGLAVSFHGNDESLMESLVTQWSGHRESAVYGASRLKKQI